MSLSHILLQKWNRFNWTSGPIRVERERARILWLHKWKTVERFCFVFVAMNMSEYVQTVNYFCCVAMMSPLPFIQTWAKIRRENHEYLGTRLNTLKMETRAFFTWSYASPVFEIKTQWFKTFTWNLMKGREILHIIIFTQFQKFTIFHAYVCSSVPWLVPTLLCNRHHCHVYTSSHLPKLKRCPPWHSHSPAPGSHDSTLCPYKLDSRGPRVNGIVPYPVFL